MPLTPEELQKGYKEYKFGYETSIVDPTTNSVIRTYAEPQVAAQPTSITPAVVPTASNGFGALPTQTPFVSEYDRLSQERYKDTQKPIDTEAIRKQKIAQFQAEIDATNQIYTNLISKAQVEGQGRLGQQRAISNRSGIASSPRGVAQAENVATLNRGIEADIESRRNAAVTAIMTQAQNKADEEIAKREEAKRLGADQYLAYLASAEERKATNAKTVLQSLLAQGLKLEDISQQQFTELANSLRMTTQELTNVYKGELTKAEATRKSAELDRLDKSLENNLKYGVEGKYFLQGGLVRRSSNGEPLTQQQLFSELGVTSWNEVPEGIIDTSISTPEDRKLLQENYQFAVGQSLKEREFGLNQEKFGFDQAKFNAELGLKYQELNRLLNNDQLDAAVKNTEIQKKMAEIQELNIKNGTGGMTAKDQANLQNVSDALEAVNGLVNHPGFDSAVGAKGLSSLFGLKGDPIPGTKAADFKSQLDRIKSLITLPQLEKLKGLGAMSDREFATLSAAAAALNRDMSQEAFKKELERVQKALDSTKTRLEAKSLFDKFEHGGSEGTNPKAPLSQVGPKTLASTLVNKFPEGSTGGQCGDFVRTVAKNFGLDYPRLGDSLQSKISVVQKNGTSLTNAGTGSVIVTKENPTYGHVAFIVGRTSEGFVVAESNFKQSNKISYGRVIPYNSNKIVGVINPSKTA